MHAIAPDMVLGKELVDAAGGHLGEIVDVGLFDHQRVKFLVVEDKARSIPIRCVGIESIDAVDQDSVRIRLT